MEANPADFQAPALQLRTLTSPGATRIRCIGRLTSDTALSLKQEVRNHIAKGQRIVVDLGELTYMDSMGLGTLVGLYVSAKTSGAHVILDNATVRIKELLRVTRLASVFEGHGPDS